MQKKCSTAKLSKWTEVSSGHTPVSELCTTQHYAYTPQSLTHISGSISYTPLRMHEGCILKSTAGTLLGALKYDYGIESM